MAEQQIRTVAAEVVQGHLFTVGAGEDLNGIVGQGHASLVVR